MIRQQQQPSFLRRHSNMAVAVEDDHDHHDDDDDDDTAAYHDSDDVISLDSLESNNNNHAAAAAAAAAEADDHDPLLGRDLNATNTAATTTTDLAREETAAVSRLRGVILLVLVVAAAMVAGAVYVNTRKTQVQNFATAFQDASQQLVQAFSIQQRLESMDALAADMVMYAAAAAAAAANNDNKNTTTWPAVTMQDFARRAMSTARLMDVSRVWWLPIVEEQKRNLWENFATHHTEWTRQDMMVLEEGATVAKPSRRLQDNDNNNTAIAPHIFDAHGVLPPTAPGPFTPLWQMAPVELNLLQWVNFNTLSLPSWKQGLEAVLRDQKAVVSEVLVMHHPKQSLMSGDSYDFASKATSDDDNNNAEPYSQIFYPVLDEALNNNDNAAVVAILAFEASWKYYLQNVLPPSAQGVIAVVENECTEDSTFRYEINGEHVQYLGVGDKHHYHHHHHRNRYHHWHASQVLNVTVSSIDFNTDYCPYTLHVYPSTSMRDHYLNHQPIIYAVLVSLMFLFATMVFALYDCLVEERQKVVMTQALQSTAIVSSLFPEQVRERLFRRNSMQDGTGRNENIPMVAAADAPATGAEYSNHWEESINGDDNSFILFDSAKNRLLSFLDKGSISRRSSANSLSGPVADPPNGPVDQPIADSFPNCTVLFADIAGFTAWSSLREPTQVFTLLESVYQAFDKIARKRGVFKVETVGDSVGFLQCGNSIF